MSVPFLRPISGLLLAPLLIAALPAHAADKSAPADAQVLDFIADWQGADGQWVDPMTFARIDPAKVEADAAKRHGKTALPAAGSDAVPAAHTGRASR